MKKIVSLQLKGKTSKGRSLIASHGVEWAAHATRDSVAFSSAPGPWCLAVPKDGPEHWRWISMTDDPDFFADAGGQGGGLPDLDLMAPRDLDQFWFRHRGGKNYTEIRPRLGPRSKDAVLDMVTYAANRSLALKIPADQKWLDVCDTVYARLPEGYRWRSARVGVSATVGANQ